MLKDRIKATQSRDPVLFELKENVQSGKFTYFTLDDEGILWISGRICIPDMEMEDNHYGFHSRVTSFKG